MPPQWLQQLIPIAAVTLGLLLGFVLLGRRLPISPRQTQRQSRLTLAFAVVAFAAVAFTLVSTASPRHNARQWWSLVCFGTMGALALYQWLRKPAVHEELANFAADPRHCGRCGYDLTGNVSGICPECGWKIPQGDLDIDSPNWGLWWRRWKIEHLRRWRATLINVLVFALAFAALAVALWIYFHSLAGTALAIAMAAHMGINVVRVWAYGRAHPVDHHPTPGSAGTHMEE